MISVARINQSESTAISSGEMSANRAANRW